MGTIRGKLTSKLTNKYSKRRRNTGTMRRTRTSGNVLRPSPTNFNNDNLSSIISDENMRKGLPYLSGLYFQMLKGLSAPLDYNNYDYYFWTGGAWSPFTGNDRSMKPGYYLRYGKGTTGATGTTTSSTSNTGLLDFGYPTPLQPAPTSPSYGYNWYTLRVDPFNAYSKLAENATLYNDAIKAKTLDYNLFNDLRPFMKEDIYNAMDTDATKGEISQEEYDAYLNNASNKNKFYSSLTGNSWLNPQGMEFYNYINKYKGLDRSLMYNDYNRILYGNDLTKDSVYKSEGDNTRDNQYAINYLRRDAPSSSDDKYKLGRAYNEAVRSGNSDLARRLSLYMTDEGIKHYGMHDHFDLGHLLGRWDRKLSNGQTVGKFLDWIYNYNLKTPLNPLTLYNIVRKATKWNFDLDDNFWKSLGKDQMNLKQAYADEYNKNFKDGGQIFRMLFV